MIALGRHGSKALGLAVLVLTQAERISTPESNEDEPAGSKTEQSQDFFSHDRINLPVWTARK